MRPNLSVLLFSDSRARTANASLRPGCWKNPVSVFLATLFAVLLFKLPVPAIAQPDGASPQQALLLISTVSDRMLAALAGENDNVQDDHQRVEAMVEAHILPHVDFVRMSRLVLGKRWRSAGQTQRSRFVEEFRRFLVRFYSTAYIEYSKDNDVTRHMIRFLPLREQAKKGRVTVRSLVRQPNSGQDIPVNYKLFFSNGQWKVFDVSIDGVSMVINYRNCFTAEIRKLGLDGLIQRLADKNREMAR